MSLFQIKVTSGSCAGDIIPVSSGEAVPIGRSRHSGNRIIFAEMDVSSKHCIVRALDDGTVELEVISDKKTTLDGQMLHSGDRVSLRCGQKVEIGGTASFVIEPGDDGNMPTSMASGSPTRESDMATSMAQSAPTNKDEGNMPTSMMPSPPRNAAPGSNAAPAPVGAPAPKLDDNRTKAKENYETIYVSTEELNSKKKKYQFRRLLKSISLGAAVLLFFVVSGVLFFLLREDTESSMDWPDPLNDPKAESRLVLRTIVGIVFPSTLNYKVSGDNLEVHSAFGRKRDIPLHIQASAWDDPDGLHKDRMEAFNQCLEQLKQGDMSLVFEQIDKEPFFVNIAGVKGSAGVPLNSASYTRRVGDDDYFGYLVFFRYEIQNFYCMYEVPLSMKMKTMSNLKALLPSMFLVLFDVTPCHWEGCRKYRETTDIKKDLDDAKLALQKNNESEWSPAAYFIQSALIKSHQANDRESLEKAKELLVKLREAQEHWYHNKKLDYDRAKNSDDKNAVRAIQREGERVFSFEQFQFSDYRYNMIVIRKEWK